MSRLAVVCTLALLAPAAHAQTAADSAAIRATAHDYIDGWWTGDGDRMARALHPELVKRIVNRGDAGAFVSGMGASQLTLGARRGFGRETPEAERRSEVRILDIFQNIAAVRIDAGAWVDHLQLVRWDGRWVILNVLWETRQ